MNDQVKTKAREGRRARGSRGTILSYKAVGSLSVASGRVIACDGIIVKAAPFARSIAPGSYPVGVCLAREGAQKHVAAAVLHVDRGNAPVRWEVAHRQDVLWPRNYYVESGLGAFVDERAVRYIRELPGDEYLELVEEALAPMEERANQWASVPLGEGGNIVLFTAGYGDLVYTSYVGLAADEGIVCFLTDFLVLEETHERAAIDRLYACAVS